MDQQDRPDRYTLAPQHSYEKYLNDVTRLKQTGVIDSVGDYLNAPFHNHKIKVTSGVLANDAKDILTKFFAKKRINRRC